MSVSSLWHDGNNRSSRIADFHERVIPVLERRYVSHESRAYVQAIKEGIVPQYARAEPHTLIQPDNVTDVLMRQITVEDLYTVVESVYQRTGW